MKAKYSRIIVPGTLVTLVVIAMNAHAQAAPVPPPIPVPAPVAIPPALVELEPFAAPDTPAPAAPALLTPATSSPATPVPIPGAPAVAPAAGPATPVEPSIIPVTPFAKPTILAPIVASVGPAGQPGRITGTRVNARGKSTIFSHPVFQFQKGEPVNVLEKIGLATPKAGEPTKWLRIQVPGDVGLWVHSSFIDPKTTTVKATRLNVRSGPGDNFPILCRLPQGTQMRATPNKVENWQEILAPPQSSVYVAAQFVTFGGGEATPSIVPVPSATASQPAPLTPSPPASQIITVPLNALAQPKVETVTPQSQPAPSLLIKANPVAGLKNPPKSGNDNPTLPSRSEGAKLEPPRPTKPAPPEGGTSPKPATVVETNSNKTNLKETPLRPNASTITESEKTNPGTEKPSWIKKLLAKSPKEIKSVKIEKLPGTENENLPVRIVRREGILQRTLHIQAPSSFVLENLETGKTMNFLYTANTRIPSTLMKKLRGRHVVVTGEEAIEPRWKDTPMLIIQTIKTLDSVADNN